MENGSFTEQRARIAPPQSEQTITSILKTRASIFDHVHLVISSLSRDLSASPQDDVVLGDLLAVGAVGSKYPTPAHKVRTRRGY